MDRNPLAQMHVKVRFVHPVHSKSPLCPTFFKTALALWLAEWQRQSEQRAVSLQRGADGLGAPL